MKIVLFGMSYYNYTSSMEYAFIKLGHEVLTVIDDNKGLRSRNLNSNKEKMIGFRPDIFINFCGNYKYNLIDAKFLKRITGKKVLMYADAIKFVGDVEQNIALYDKVVTFERDDIEFLKKKYGVNGTVLSGSVAEEIFCKEFDNVNKIYDLSFVGVMVKERLDFFEIIAKYAYDNKLKMIVYGKFYKDKHWYSAWFNKCNFIKKYPYLSRFAVNTYIKPEEAARLYCETKICLNKHIDRHQSMNYRVFEIMANNNFELCDERQQAEEFGLVDGCNIAFYKNVNECIEKIEYYLSDEMARNKIAASGGAMVRNEFTTRVLMKKLLSDI